VSNRWKALGVGTVLVLALSGASSKCGTNTPAPAKTHDTSGEHHPDVRGTINPYAVADLCDYFNARALETLLEQPVEQNVYLLAQDPGVPQGLADRARQFYANGTTLKSLDGKKILTERYEEVMQECLDLGWTAAHK
jgi:hypothetical protein